MADYTNPQQRKKEESKRRRGGRDQIEFIDPRFEQWQAVRFRKGRRRQEVPEIHPYYYHWIRLYWSLVISFTTLYYPFIIV